MASYSDPRQRLSRVPEPLNSDTACLRTSQTLVDIPDAKFVLDTQSNDQSHANVKPTELTFTQAQARFG